MVPDALSASRRAGPRRAFRPRKRSRLISWIPALLNEGPTGDSFEAAIEIIPLDGENHDTDVMLRFADPPYKLEDWSAPQSINKDGPGNSQFLPRIAVDQTTGHVALSWYDTRNLDLTQVRLFANYSTDRGVSFSQESELPVYMGISSGTPPGAHQGTLGDYIGLDFRDGFFITAWGDNSGPTDNPDGRTEVFAAKRPVP